MKEDKEEKKIKKLHLLPLRLKANRGFKVVSCCKKV